MGWRWAGRGIAVTFARVPIAIPIDPGLEWRETRKIAGAVGGEAAYRTKMKSAIANIISLSHRLC